MKKFDKPGFPEILINKDHFEIRRKGDDDFAQFMFKDINEIDYVKGDYKLWKMIFFGFIWVNPRTYMLKITLNNKEKWVYETTETFDNNFAGFIKLLIKSCGLK